jgi:hypothetical protein
MSQLAQNFDILNALILLAISQSPLAARNPLERGSKIHCQHLNQTGRLWPPFYKEP